MPTLIIDEKEITVPEGTTILQAAKSLGIDIPHFCYDGMLSIAGSCRMCVVEIEGASKLVTSCSTPAVEGTRVFTDSERVKKSRAAVMEFLLLNHPLDCPVCDQAGECVLQKYSYEHGYPESRFIEERTVQAKKDIGPGIWLYADRCILCSRCVRFCREVSGTGELAVINRGYVSEIDIFSGKPLDNPLAKNTVDICPVGALLSKDFLFKSRVWELTPKRSVCPFCSRGCEFWLDVKGGQIFRARGRPSPNAEGEWICDEGRSGVLDLQHGERLRSPMIDKGGKLTPVSWNETLRRVEAVLRDVIGSRGGDCIAAIGSPFATNEENSLLGKLVSALGGGVFTVLPAPLGDRQEFLSDFVIEAERAPNVRGATRALSASGNVISFEDFINKVKGGEIVAAFVLCGFPNGWEGCEGLEVLDSLSVLIVHDIILSPLSSRATVALPGCSFAEKSGSYENCRGEERLFEKALEPIKECRDDLEILRGIANQMGLAVETDAADLASVEHL